MIEMVYNGKESKGQSEVRLPKNIRQIGDNNSWAGAKITERWGRMIIRFYKSTKRFYLRTNPTPEIFPVRS